MESSEIIVTGTENEIFQFKQELISFIKANKINEKKVSIGSFVKAKGNFTDNIKLGHFDWVECSITFGTGIAAKVISDLLTKWITAQIEKRGMRIKTSTAKGRKRNKK